jgi:putative FmdB family regulatory protein
MSERTTRLLLDCDQCDKIFEVSRTMAQERNVRCPYCGEKNWTGRIRECQRAGEK